MYLGFYCFIYRNNKLLFMYILILSGICKSVAMGSKKGWLKPINSLCFGVNDEKYTDKRATPYWTGSIKLRSIRRFFYRIIAIFNFLDKKTSVF
mgnify:CR=1 FL=1